MSSGKFELQLLQQFQIYPPTMAGLIELNTFVGKFVRLWQSGSDARLKIESKAGKASVTLQLDLGYPHHPPQQNHAPSPARVRRSQRRAGERQAAAEADQEQHRAVVEAEQAKAVQQADHERADAEQATQQAEQANKDANITPRPPTTLAAEVKVGATAAEAVKDYPCDLCEKTFGTLKGLRAHTGKLHKASSSSPIPQIDGCNDAMNEPNYCKVCKCCPNEIETSEDISYHVMNNHVVKEVIDAYGQDWASERRYCIRRWSPFENFFLHK